MPDREWPDSTKLGGFRRMEMLPVVKMGGFAQGFLGNRRLTEGWIFDNRLEHRHKPAWSADLLYEMMTTTLDSIKALPGPASW